MQNHIPKALNKGGKGDPFLLAARTHFLYEHLANAIRDDNDYSAASADKWKETAERYATALTPLRRYIARVKNDVPGMDQHVEAALQSVTSHMQEAVAKLADTTQEPIQRISVAIAHLRRESAASALLLAALEKSAP